MPRYALKIEYDGGPFSGWQRQKGLPTVQGALEAALRRIDPSGPLVQGAGRTDAGVHALGQVAHVDLARDWPAERLAGAVNFHLKPAPVAIVAAAAVDQDFHARFSALERQYRYHLLSRRAPVVHRRGQVWQVPHALALEPMRHAARHLLGTHDFTTFRSSTCQSASPRKTLDLLDITEEPADHGHAVRFDVHARSFLHNQVRSFVGTLERVGAGAWQPEDVAHALQAADRTACGPVAPPQGLFLTAVIYPDDPFA
ncbi:tRNA pseudouridine(38-40) synthase TruA [Brevirhabdus sp.]|uniref:tRNA pseudouridine(38-40) synthase TruA n=1 Tax=Brevirhabdus sp. TaxID=2004514 RepID=UPI0040589DDB